MTTSRLNTTLSVASFSICLSYLHRRLPTSDLTSTSHFLNLKLVDSKPWLMTMSLCWFDNTICLFLISNLCLEFKIQVTVIILYLPLKLVLNFSDKFDKKIFLCISLNLLLIIRSFILCLWYSMVQEKCINELELSFLLSRTEARVKLFV